MPSKTGPCGVFAFRSKTGDISRISMMIEHLPAITASVFREHQPFPFSEELE